MENLDKIKIKEVDGWWEITLFEDESGDARSGISYKVQPGETMEDIRKRLPSIIHDYNRHIG